MKLRSQRSVVREYRRVQALIALGRKTQADADALYGAQQALAWALSNDAMAPRLLFAPRAKSGEGAGEP